MKELLYLEIPTPDRAVVVSWLQELNVTPVLSALQSTPDGIRVEQGSHALAVFTWSVNNTTYLKAFQWSEQPFPQQAAWLKALETAARDRFPNHYPELPPYDGRESIFAALEPHYPLTAKYFQRIPNGEADLQRVYWWEKRWRQEARLGIRPPQQLPLLKEEPPVQKGDPEWDVVVIGGALGAIQAAIMAQMGYRVALVERLTFGRMNREWNISRQELGTLSDLGLFSVAETEGLILRAYVDGFNKFFDGNSPVKAPILHTPTVLNLAIDAEKLLRMCGEKIRQAGGKIFDRTEFQRAYCQPDTITLELKSLEDSKSDDSSFYLVSRLLVDAMGTASPIAQQINGHRAFDSVCPTVGATITSGIPSEVWDPQFGDILASHGDISRGRQLIWELFPGPDQDLTVYLFHYHQVHPDNPGSLLQMYEDFFTIVPEYRRCEMEDLTFKKATFGYIPGRFGRVGDQDLSFDRVLTIGDASAMQSPLSFTGFGALVRNSPRLADLLDTALQHDLLTARDLQRVRAFQGNAAVTWMFSQGMMVPTGRNLRPGQANAMLNSFFGILAAEDPEVADRFIKDRASWWDFTRLALGAARYNPLILVWIWQMVGFEGFRKWIPTYLSFTGSAFVSWLCGSWAPPLLRLLQPQIEPRWPRLWHRLLTWSYDLTYGQGRPRLEIHLPGADLQPKDPNHLSPDLAASMGELG